MNIHHSRFKDAAWYPIKHSVIVGGSGGIGSWCVFFLARAGFPEITVYDKDFVEEGNISGQMFNISNVNKPKVDAIEAIVNDFTSGTTIYPMDEWYDEESMSGNIMVSAFDNMKARKVMFNNWKEYMLSTDEPCLFVDGRLLAEQYKILVVSKNNYESYEENHLFDDSEVADEACNYKQTTHFAAMIAANMTTLITNWLAKASGTFRTVTPYTEYLGLMNNHERKQHL